MAARITDEFGHIDVFFANAGIREKSFVLIHEKPVEDWDDVINADLRAVFLQMRAVFPLMMERGGSFVTTSSVGGMWPLAQDKWVYTQTAYAVAKAGLIMLTKAAARQYGPYGIRVNAISPGYHRTPLTPAARGGGSGTDDRPAAAPGPMRHARGDEGSGRVAGFGRLELRHGAGPCRRRRVLSMRPARTRCLRSRLDLPQRQGGHLRRGGLRRQRAGDQRRQDPRGRLRRRDPRAGRRFDRGGRPAGQDACFPASTTLTCMPPSPAAPGRRSPSTSASRRSRPSPDIKESIRARVGGARSPASGSGAPAGTRATSTSASPIVPGTSPGGIWTRSRPTIPSIWSPSLSTSWWPTARRWRWPASGGTPGPSPARR